MSSVYIYTFPMGKGLILSILSVPLVIVYIWDSLRILCFKENPFKTTWRFGFEVLGFDYSFFLCIYLPCKLDLHTLYFPCKLNTLSRYHPNYPKTMVWTNLQWRSMKYQVLDNEYRWRWKVEFPWGSDINFMSFRNDSASVKWVSERNVQLDYL